MRYGAAFILTLHELAILNATEYIYTNVHIYTSTLKQNLIKRPELLSHVLAKFGRKG
jgi:hypothetical protein